MKKDEDDKKRKGSSPKDKLKRYVAPTVILIGQLIPSAMAMLPVSNSS